MQQKGTTNDVLVEINLEEVTDSQYSYHFWI